MIKFGVIGYGYWGPNVVRNLQSIAGAEVLSVCDKSSAARRRIHPEAALRQFANYPFTGLGMWTAARFGVLAKIGYTQTATIHSDWVEIIVGADAWGVIRVVVLMAMA
jgi:predicted homoserine dehydrogenase-like protein